MAVCQRTNDPSGLKIIAARLAFLTALDRESDTVVLPIGDCLRELDSWLRHPREAPWLRARTGLRLECARTVASLGPELMAAFGSRLMHFTQDLNDLASASRRIPTGSRRRGLASDAQALLMDAGSPDARRAAWRDLVAAAQYETADIQNVRAQHLCSVLELGGHTMTWPGLPLASVLENDRISIALGRNVPLPDDPSGPGDASPAERLSICEDLVAGDPRSGRCVVWLAYRSAAINRMVEELGPICLFEARWAIPNAVNDDGQDFPFRAELRDPGNHWLVHERGQLVDEERPVILVRVDLGLRPVAHAIDEARSAVAAIVTATAVQRHGVTWDYGGYLSLFVDGRVWQTSGLVRDIPRDSMYDRSRTAQGLTESGAALATAVITQRLTPQLVEAVHCLADSEHGDPRSEILLLDRAVEMIAGFTGCDGDEIERLGRMTWPVIRLRASVVGAVHTCLHRARLSDRHVEGDRLDRLVRSFGANGLVRLDLAKVAEHLEDFRALVRGTGHDIWAFSRLDLLQSSDRLRDALNRTREDVALLAERRRRIRNALTHGNPVSDRAIASVRPVARYLGGLAVGTALGTPADPKAALAAMRDEAVHASIIRERIEQGASMLDAYLPTSPS